MLSLPENKSDKGGCLRFLNLGNLPFSPQRMFWVCDVPAGEYRGGHGHLRDKQQLFCIKGKIIVNLYSKSGFESFALNEGDSCFMDSMVWAEQLYITGEDILLVLCSEQFDKQDYFYDKKEVYNENVLHGSGL